MNKLSGAITCITTKILINATQTAHASVYVCFNKEK